MMISRARSSSSPCTYLFPSCIKHCVVIGILEVFDRVDVLDYTFSADSSGRDSAAVPCQYVYTMLEF
jgi:hypothetical protein